MERPPKNDLEEPLDAAAAVNPHQATAAATPDEGDAWTGRILDQRYRIVRLLGQGGMGAVYVAEQLTLHKTVALKVIREELAGNGEVAARFAREAMATAQFEHPHVASAIDYGTLPEGGAYFVMQLVRGQSLQTLISDGKRLPWRRAAELCAQIADALSAAESAAIIHRDLKPDNVLVEPRDDGSDLVKVLDFGIAHIAPRDAAAPPGAQADRQLTRVGTVMGTPGYMSPEQAVGDAVDHRTDLYALGVVLWECIAGRELWEGPDLTTVVARQMGEAVPKLRDLGIDPTVPLELDALVQRLTSRTVSRRPEHAAEVRDTLRRLAIARGPLLSPVLGGTTLSALAPRLVRTAERFKAQSLTARYVQLSIGLLAFVSALMLGRGDPEDKKGDSAIEKLMRSATAAVQAAPAPPPTMPKELVDDVTRLTDADTSRERRAAADKILAYEPRSMVFPHVRTIAELEAARSCKGRKAIIMKMESERDVRYLPPLQRLARSPRSGCGFLSLGDCYSCLRGSVRDAIKAIEGAQPAPPKPADMQ